MQINPSLQEVNKIALEFAKAIISNNPDISKNKLISESMGLAIQWIESEQKRELLFKQHYPNWINLQEQKELSFFEEDRLFDFNKDYWIVGKEVNGDRERLTVIKGSLYESSYRDYDSLIPNFKLKTKQGIYQALYILTDEDGQIFNENFKPKIPFYLMENTISYDNL